MDTRTADQTTQMREIIDRALSRVNTCIPGVIQSFDSSAQTASVIPAIQSKKIVDDIVSFEDYPVIVNVPVIFPFVTTLGFALTLPIQSGDSCILLFAQRALDNWHDLGGIQPPETTNGGVRHHDLTDAIAILAAPPAPNILSNWNDSGIEIRNSDRSNRITLDDASIELKVGATTKIVITDGQILFQVGTKTFTMTETNIESNTTIDTTGDIISNDVVLDSHIHGGTEPGSGTTGGPV